MDNIYLLKNAREGNKEAYEEFFKENQPLVFSLLKRYHVRKSDYDDALAQANYGLLLAIRNFDFSFEVSFSTYAVPLIIGEIKKFFRESSLIKVSRGNRDLYYRIIKASDELENKLLRSPSLEEIAIFLNINREDVLDALSSNSYISSLDEEIDENNDSSIISNISSQENINFIEKMDLKLGIEKLDKKEKLIISLRYYQGLSQQEVSKRLSMTQVQVSRLESKALNKLKELI